MSEIKEREGYRSKNFGHLGVYFLSTGPDPLGPMPGERVIIVIYNSKNEIVRRLEQVRGDCLDEGWIDFFESAKCRPSVYEYHLIDFDQYGNREILASHTDPPHARAWLDENFPKWSEKHGIREN